MRPSRVLKIYYLTTFVIGTLLTMPVAHWVQTQELGGRGAAGMTLCWNVLFIMLLPLVLDWGERRYFKARFMALEEVAKTNPELASLVSEQCKKLNLPNLRFAIIDTADEMFSYGLWRNNPRLVVSGNLLSEDNSKVIPSIEAELTRFTSQDHTFVFLAYTVVQLMLLQILIAFVH